MQRLIKKYIEKGLIIELRTTFYSANEEDRQDLEEFMHKLIKDCKRIKGKEYFINWIPQNDFRKYIK